MAPPMPLAIRPGIIQLARSPLALTCMPPRMARSMWPPRIMAKLSAESKNDAPGRTGHGLLARVDQVGIELVTGRVGPDAEDAVLGVQHDVRLRRQVIRNQGGDADAEVDVLAGPEFGGGPCRQRGP